MEPNIELWGHGLGGGTEAAHSANSSINLSDTDMERRVSDIECSERLRIILKQLSVPEVNERLVTSTFSSLPVVTQFHLIF